MKVRNAKELYDQQRSISSSKNTHSCGVSCKFGRFPGGITELRQLKAGSRTDPIAVAGTPVERKMTPLRLRSSIISPEITATSCGKADEPASAPSPCKQTCVHIPTHIETNAETTKPFRIWSIHLSRRNS
jgi:hypothetical protein